MNLQELERNVIEVCGEVGDFIIREGSDFDRTRIEQKNGFNNLVSYVDQEAERRLVKVLKKILREAGLLLKKGTVEQSKTKTYNWIIDPLDGTTNYLHGLPIYAVSVGLTRGEQPILGVVYHVVRKECFHATEEGNAYCNGKAIQVSSIPTLQESLLATGFPYYHFDKRDNYLEIIKIFWKTHMASEDSAARLLILHMLRVEE
jgi:myo-inositol-1(or 4)-monophosphatase